jgi:plasmid stabilization system protein ParE
MNRVTWSEGAAQDFEAALSHIAEENPQNAALVRNRIFNTLSHLESFNLGTPGPLGSLKLYIPKTSYFVIFRRAPDGDVSIRAFVHTSMDWESMNWDRIV